MNNVTRVYTTVINGQTAVVKVYASSKTCNTGMTRARYSRKCMTGAKFLARENGQIQYRNEK